MRVHHVKDVNEAVRLASDMKRRDEHDWFRGQVQDWPLKSSFCRVEASNREDALQKAARFEHWVKRTPGLEHLASNADAIIAVAQHYGIPTNFVDFTTDPAIAGFFASDGPPRDSTRESCILCLNTADLNAFWERMPPRYPPPEFIRLEVPNLWRLEAQFGTFLFCPYANFEHIYDLDRIVFPYVGRVAAPTADDVYPKRKSQLEILLDQYFMNEQLREGDLDMRRRVAAGLASVVEVSREETYDADLFSGGPPPPLASWHPERLRPWLAAEREYYSRAGATLAVDLNVDHLADGPDVIRDRLKALILKELIQTQ